MRLKILTGLLIGGLISCPALEGGAQSQWRGLNSQKCAVVDCTGGNTTRQRDDYTPPSAQPSREDLRQIEADRVKAMAEAGNYAAARRAAKKMQDEYPADASWLVRELSRRVFWPGNQLLDQHRSLEAIDEFRRAIPDWPTNAYEHLTLARALLDQSRQDDPTAAKSHLEEASTELRAALFYKSDLSASDQQQVDGQVRSNTETVNVLTALNRQAIADRQDKNTVDAIHGNIDALTQSFKPVTGGAFGRADNPANPGLEFMNGAPPPVEVRNTADQAASAAKSGAFANASGNSIEKTKYLSNCAFDAATCAKYDPVQMDRVRTIGQTEGAAALFAAIPAQVRADRQILNSMAYFEKQDGLTIETAAKIDTVGKQISGGTTGNVESLKAYKATLDAELARYVKEKAKAMTEVKKRVLDLGLHMEPENTAGKGP